MLNLVHVHSCIVKHLYDRSNERLQVGVNFSNATYGPCIQRRLNSNNVTRTYAYTL